MTKRSVKELIILLFICLILGGYLIPRRQVWIDEVGSWVESGMSVKEIIAFSAFPKETHPPFYYILLHFWRGIGPNQGSLEVANPQGASTGQPPYYPFEINLRVLSLIFALLSVISVYLLAKELFEDERIPFISGFLLISSAAFLYYSREIRMYSLSLLLSSLSSYLFMLYYKKPSIIRGLAYSIVISLGFYTHYFIIPLMFLHWLYYLVMKIREYRLGIIKMIYPAIISLLLFIPFVPTLQRQSELLSGLNLFEVKQPLIDFISLYRWFLFGYHLKPFVFAIMGYILLILLLGISFVYFKRYLKVNIFLSMLVWFVPLGFLISSLFTQTSAQKRLFIVFLPYLVLFIAGGIANLKKTYTIILIILCLALSIYSDTSYRPERIFLPSRTSAAYIKTEYNPSTDIIISQGVTLDGGLYAFDYLSFYIGDVAEILWVYRATLRLIDQKYFIPVMERNPRIKSIQVECHWGTWDNALLKKALDPYLINKNRIWLCNSFKFGNDDPNMLFRFYKDIYGFNLNKEKSREFYSFEIYLLER